jgi:hypothetical protein
LENLVDGMHAVRYRNLDWARFAPEVEIVSMGVEVTLLFLRDVKARTIKGI